MAGSLVDLLSGVNVSVHRRFSFIRLKNKVASKLIFPISSKVVIRDPFDPAHRIDREVGERGRRLIIGLSLEPDCKTIIGSLIVVEGSGKYLRVIRSKTTTKQLPEVASDILGKLRDSDEPSLLDLRAAQEDIAVVQAEIVESLKQDAGKYVDRLLIAAISDPGLWPKDSTQQKNYFPICDPNLLADATGINVVDAFPIRDISSGGSGRLLQALPAWLLFADRAAKQAHKNSMFVSFGNETNAFFLPASDGLDVEIPEIRSASTIGLEILNPIANPLISNTESFEAAVARLNVTGRFDEQLAKCLGSIQTEEYEDENFALMISDSIPNFTRTAIVHIVKQVSDQIRSQLTGNTIVHEIIVDSHPDLVGTFVNQVQRVWSNAVVSGQSKSHLGNGSYKAVLSATLGAMSIDQMPANVPWITGADCQRILGRITPGSPTNWRQLLREMADFQPPAMRLRDAV